MIHEDLSLWLLFICQICKKHLKIIYQRQTGKSTRRALKDKGKRRVLHIINQNLFRNNLFFHAWAIFNWIFHLLDSKNWFCTFFNFLHFGAGCKKNYPKPFGIQILIFIWSNHWPRLPRKWTMRIYHYDCYLYAKFAKNISKLHISVKPEILPEGR